ncbi:MAG: sugar phosphate isomerase/epimerase family protein [Gemmatimonadota bacterium]|nr:sugar phosphate isomerase/epimerase family protein [Gemmatimonadota bacterium]
MRIAVSNIAWDPADDDAVAEMLVGHGVEAIEVAPTMIWPDPSSVDRGTATATRELWAGRGLPVVSFQALLYGHPELRLFGSEEERERTVEYLDRIIGLAGAVGAGALVFGSPGNRRRGDLPVEEADAVAIALLRRVGASAAARGCTFCIEPNPTDYGCDWVTSASRGRDVVTRVGHRGVGLHLDSGAMTLAGDDIDEEIRESAPILAHFHISEPDLAPVGGGAVDHASFAAALRRVDYRGWCSLEMRNPGDLRALAESVAFAVRAYG